MTTTAREDVEKLYLIYWSINEYNQFSWQNLLKQNVVYPAVLLSGSHLTQISIHVDPKIYPRMFRTGTIVYPKSETAYMPISIKKEKVLYIHTVDFYTVIRMNELKLHTVI